MVSQTTDANIGNPVPLTPEDERIITEFTSANSRLTGGEDEPLGFKNIILAEGMCGFASSGVNQYLLNTDRKNCYRVTVRTFFQNGNVSEQYDDVFTSNAGGKLALGCTRGPTITGGAYSRSVVGEVLC